MKGGSSELLLDPQAELRKRKLLDLAAKKPKPIHRTCRQKFWFYATSFFTMSAVSAGSSLLFLVPLYVDPAISTLVADFTPEPVTCITIRKEEHSGIFNCTWSSCREGCTSDMYRCTHIYVNYTPYGNDTLDDVYEEAVLLVNIKGCGYPPDVNCSDFTNSFGEKGAEFPCYYSRQNRTVVMRHYNRDRQVEVIINYFAIPFVITVVTSVVLCVMHCDCRRSQVPVLRRTKIHDHSDCSISTRVERMQSQADVSRPL
ncbi:tipE homolog 1 phospholipid transfer protein isoform X2 [Rhodnius prolixus]|uniref:tipE homolog 1 phospholipid transfer protein isoform X2 n=1 Tax=Rhodnius prolixus TaxID=13249 RepID=UPI003D18B1B8